MDKKNKVIRFNEIHELRAAQPTEENGAIVEGYAIVYDEETNIGGWFRETIRAGALIGANLKDVPFFVHHQRNKIPLARSRNNNSNSTLQLRVDDRGLYFKAELDTENNSEAKALYSAVNRGDITGMSFAFSVLEEAWRDKDKEVPLREIIKFDKIFEISALSTPQYQGSDINARSEPLDSADKQALDNALRSKETDDSENEQGQKELELERLKLNLL
ncbi:HK97 family phage prohead protease [Bacillus sp. FJAT-45350]|uniref:HK97 family phage prohead protease n=1 Tax=Bacillus sp. FJAT-45350 TaxID=2011014 RepID=UPI0015C8FE35|nr:HK97 family phage prohead protease [Bacillus sp. FJAT-45350]